MSIFPISQIVKAEILEEHVTAFVEALRLAAPQTGREDDGLYSDWQIKPDNIRRWSKRCLEEELSPAQFESDSQKARQILACKMGEVLRKEFSESGNQETMAVQRAAAWWMTGDPTRYSADNIKTYVQKVLDFYKEELEKSANTAH